MKMQKNRMVCLLVVMLCMSLVAFPVRADVYRVGGTWNQTGTGTIDEETYYDKGTFVVTSYIDDSGIEWITQYSASGTETLGTYHGSYSYSLTAEDIGGEVPLANNHTSMVYDGMTYDLTLISENQLVLTIKGIESSTGRDFDLTYNATRSSSNGGGGCNTGFTYLSAIFLLFPLGILLKK